MNKIKQTIYNGWQTYQVKLIQALAPLTAEQLDLRPAPHLRSIREIAQHIIGARGRWFYRLMGEGGAQMEALGIWDRLGMHGLPTPEM